MKYPLNECIGDIERLIMNGKPYMAYVEAKRIFSFRNFIRYRYYKIKRRVWYWSVRFKEEK